MAGSPKKRARKDRAKTFLDEPNAIGRICGRIASGPGTLVDLCHEFGDLHYGTVNEWIQSDEHRRKAYKEAIDVRKEHAHEHVFRELITLIKADFTEAYKYQCSKCSREVERVDGAWMHRDDSQAMCDDAGADMVWKDLCDIPPALRKFIVGMEVEELFSGTGKHRIQIGITRKIKFVNKERGYELMAKHLGMLIDKRELSGKLTLEDLLEASNVEDSK